MLEIKNISKVFNQGTINQKTAINEVSLSLNDGDFVTVIGGNGAGKSTLLNLISGSYLPDQGNITIDGVALEKMMEHQRAKYIGRVFQDPMMGTCADMTIEENLAMALRRGKHRTLSRGITKKEREFFREQLKMLDLGLEDRMTSKVGLLSGGQRQAITLLMATMMLSVNEDQTVEENLLFSLNRGKAPFYHRHLTKKELDSLDLNADLKQNLSTKVNTLPQPQKEQLQELINNLTKPYLLLLDEHTAALDPKTASKVLSLTNQLVNDHHLTTIMITHNMKDALAYGNRLWMMDRGELVLDIPEEKKSQLDVKDLLELFEGCELSDRMLLAQ